MDGFSSGWMNRLSSAFHNSSIMRSGFVTVLIVAGILAAASGLWYEHIKGNLHRVRVIQAVADKPSGARPGDMDLVHLTRTPMTVTMNPEYLSATVAPGLGMQTLGATINLAAHGEVPILLGEGNDASGNPTDNSTGSPIVETISGRTGARWSAPYSVLNRQPDHFSYNAMPDGGSVEATFGGTAADIPVADTGVETKVSLTLGGHALDLVVVAKNTAAAPRAIVLRWEPRFLLGNGGVTLVPPRLESSTGGTTPAPIALGGRDVKADYARLKRSYLSNGPEVQLRNEEAGYTVHVIAVSPSVRSLHAEAQKGGKAVLLAFSTASGEPGSDEQTVLQPGETVQLRVRIEVTGISTYSR